MKNSFYSPVHFIGNKIKKEKENLVVDIKNIIHVIFNKRQGESLAYYKDGSYIFVGNNIGKEMIMLIQERNQ